LNASERTDTQSDEQVLFLHVHAPVARRVRAICIFISNRVK
jgi:hypothetical protein